MVRLLRPEDVEFHCDSLRRLRTSAVVSRPDSEKHRFNSSSDRLGISPSLWTCGSGRKKPMTFPCGSRTSACESRLRSCSTSVTSTVIVLILDLRSSHVLFYSTYT